MILRPAGMSMGWDLWLDPKAPLPSPCPCVLAKLLNEISWVLSLLVHQDCCFPNTPADLTPEPVSVSLAQKRLLQQKRG